jgi:hypothetical protein
VALTASSRVKQALEPGGRRSLDEAAIPAAASPAPALALAVARDVAAAVAAVLPLLRAEAAPTLPRAVWVAVVRRAGVRAGLDELPADLVDQALDQLLAAGELSCQAGARTLAPTAATAEPSPEPFHGVVVREALAAHWAEVRRWQMPAPSGEAWLRLAREHLRLLQPADMASNSMARLALRQRLAERLRTVDRGLAPAVRRVTPLVLVAAGVWQQGGGLDDARLAEHLEGAVLAPDNVGRVLAQMADHALCRACQRIDGAMLYFDPELPGEMEHSPDRAAAWRRLLGGAEPAQAEVRRGAAVVSPQVRATAESFGQRLQTLQVLFDDGLINADELASRRGAIIAEI